MMDIMSPIPAPLWKAVPDQVVADRVKPSNLYYAMISLQNAMGSKRPEGNLKEIYAKKVDILLRKTLETVNSTKGMEPNEREQLESAAFNLAWVIRTELSESFIRKNSRATVPAVRRAAERDSVHNLFDIMSEEDIATNLFYYLTMDIPSDRRGGHYKSSSNHYTAAGARNLVWHEVKRGNIENAKFLVSIMQDISSFLVLGIPFFQEGVWDNIPKEELKQFQKFLNKSMEKEERDISIRFAWLAGTPEGEQYIANVSSKFKPKAYKAIKSGIKSWQKAVQNRESAYLGDYVDMEHLGATPAGYMYWDFNPFGNKLYDILETAMLATLSTTWSIDDSIAGLNWSIDKMLLNNDAIKDMEETVKGYKWDLSKFPGDEYLSRCIHRLILRREPQVLKNMPTYLLSQLAEGLSREELSEKLLNYPGLRERLTDSESKTVIIKVDAETFFDKEWLPTFKEPNLGGAQLRTVVHASSPRGAKLLLESMQTTGGKPCLVTNSGNWVTAVTLKSVLEHAENDNAAEIAWKYFESWGLPATQGVAALVDAWFKVFVDCCFFQKVTEDKPVEFWEQFIELFNNHHSHLTPAAVLSLTEAVTS